MMSAVNKVNPLHLPDNDGKCMTFASATEMYVYVMTTCYGVAPKGYVDMYLILGELYELKFVQVIRVFDHWLKEPIGNRYNMIDLSSSEAKTFYRKLLIALHEWNETTFEIYAFENAFNVYQDHIKEKTIKIKGQ